MTEGASAFGITGTEIPLSKYTVSVSYTHLDVYKRQALAHVNNSNFKISFIYHFTLFSHLEKT